MKPSLSDPQRGSGGVIGLAVTLLIGFALMVYLLRTSMPTKGDIGAHRTTLDNVRNQANAVEEQQRQHQRELRDASQ